jgi:simple sugar transport system permease protein
MSNADLNEEPPSSQETTDNITTIAPRRAADFLSPFLYAVAAFAVAVLLFSAVVALAGQNPLAAGQTLVSGAVGSRERVAESLAKTIPLLMTGLSVAIAFRAGFLTSVPKGSF